MLQVSEDMLRTNRRFDSAGRPVSPKVANEIAAQSLREERQAIEKGRLLQTVLRATARLLPRLASRTAG